MKAHNDGVAAALLQPSLDCGVLRLSGGLGEPVALTTCAHDAVEFGMGETFAGLVGARADFNVQVRGGRRGPIVLSVSLYTSESHTFWYVAAVVLHCTPREPPSMSMGEAEDFPLRLPSAP